MLFRSHFINVEELTANELMKQIDNCVGNYDSIKEDLEKNYGVLKEKAQLNGEYAIELYEKGSVTL